MDRSRLERRSSSHQATFRQGVFRPVRVAAFVLGVGGFAGPAAAEGIGADIEIYGTLVPHVERIDTHGATPLAARHDATQVPDAAFTGLNEPARARVTQGTSHLGFRGTVDLLGDSLKVVWQIESGVPIDGDPVANTLASRNSRLGLSGSWGTLFVGIWDSPYKWASLPLITPIAAGFVADQASVIGTPGFNVGALNLSPSYVPNAVAGPSPVPRSNAAFYRRDANSIQYWSPAFHGLSLRASYTTNEFSRAARPATATSQSVPEIHPDIVAGALAYDNGPLALRYGIEMHRDYFGLSLLGGSPGGTQTNPSSQDVGQQALASLLLRPSPDWSTHLVATFDYLFYENNDTLAGNVDQYTRAAFYGLIDQSYRSHHLWAAYGQAQPGTCSLVGDGRCSTDGLGAALMTLGYLYRFSNETDVYAVAYQVINANAASYTPFPSIDPQPSPGANVRSIGIGMLHHFSASTSTRP